MRAVIAESFERIHRSNLVGMGVLPLRVQAGGKHAESLGLTGYETLCDSGLAEELQPGQELRVERVAADGSTAIRSTSSAALDTPVEVNYYRNGGILQTVLRKMLR